MQGPCTRLCGLLLFILDINCREAYARKLVNLQLFERFLVSMYYRSVLSAIGDACLAYRGGK